MRGCSGRQLFTAPAARWVASLIAEPTVSAQVSSAVASDSGVSLTLQPSKGGAEEKMDVDVVLVSTGGWQEGIGRWLGG